MATLQSLLLLLEVTTLLPIEEESKKQSKLTSTYTQL